MNINIICIGKLKEKYWSDAITEYSKRLGRYCTLKIKELKEDRLPDNASEAEERNVKINEGKSIIKTIGDSSYVIALDVIKRADFRLSFSPMTFPHQMMRVILLEQIYRSFKIIKNETYHK